MQSVWSMCPKIDCPKTAKNDYILDLKQQQGFDAIRTLTATLKCKKFIPLMSYFPTFQAKFKCQYFYDSIYEIHTLNSEQQ